MSETREGWVSLMNSRKYHYARDGETLCGRYMYLGNSFEEDGQMNTPKKDDCLTCWKKRKAELEQVTP